MGCRSEANKAIQVLNRMYMSEQFLLSVISSLPHRNTNTWYWYPLGGRRGLAAKG